MNDQLLYLRREHGEVFVTQLPTGQTIPWRPLSTGEYLIYNKMFQTGQYPPAFIEDEIFSKCVLDTVLVKSIGKLKAGIVSAVSATIMAYSGPQSVDELNYMMNASRAQCSDAIHDIVIHICQAFPAYKPEEVYDMDYQTLMLRAAQAERKMMHIGFISEPLSFESKNASQQQVTEAEVKQRREANQDMINRYYEQQGIKVSDSVRQARKDTREHIFDYPAPPPIPEVSDQQTVITKSDMMEHDAVPSGHEQDIVHKIKAIDETAQIYSEYLDQMKEDGKLRMLTPEERKAAAQKRMEANKQKVLERRKKALGEMKQELPELLKVREEAKKRKAKKAARRTR